MGILLGLLVLFIVLLVVLIGLSAGVAFLLHWLIPAVGLDIALLAAIIAVGQVMLMFGRVLNALPPGTEEGEREPSVVFLDREVTLPRRRRKPV